MSSESTGASNHMQERKMEPILGDLEAADYRPASHLHCEYYDRVPRSRCCIYPQADAVILPTIFNLISLVSTLMAFPLLNFWTSEPVNFMCFNDDRDFHCSPLYLNHPDYWSGNTEDWGIPMRIAAAFGVIAGICGFIALTILFTGSCFVLTVPKLRNVALLQIAAAVFAALSLVGAATDPCKANGVQGGSYCGDEYSRSIYLDTGASCMIVAFVVYIPAVIATFGWYRRQKQQEQAKIREKE